MFKYKDPLPKNPFCMWVNSISGAAGVDVEGLAKSLGMQVVERMKNDFDIDVTARYDSIQTGGMLSRKLQPGVLFEFEGRANYCGFLVGLNKIAGVLEVAAVQHGTPTAAMQRMNVAEAKGSFSLGGVLRKVVTDANAVEEEAKCYSLLDQAIQEAVKSWTE